MERVEQTETGVANLSSELKKLEAEWQSQQQQLSSNIKELEAVLSELKHKRQTLSASIDPQATEFYEQLKRQKGTAIAKIEQGICRGCRISLSTAQLQQARTGSLVQCSNCGRILFLA